ncbi:nitroreductase family protein [Streptomyces sp. NPDC004074]|uniref:nitroreductase family protein n=1 Tax=Streptomyces sp. NPDC004074 TaxID=3154277 RepID=UPI0033AAB3AB
MEFGPAGIGGEDTSGNPDQPIRGFDEAVNRVRSAVDAAKGRIVVTGRTDNFIQGRPRLGDGRHQFRAHQRTTFPRQELAQTRRTTSPYLLITRRRQIDVNLDKLMSKHLSRYLDPSKTIPEETLQQLLRFLRSTPTSTNIQPNHFYVLATPEGKERLANNLGEFDNGEKILNASHAIILTTRTDLPESHVETVFSKERADGRFPDLAQQELRESMNRDFLNFLSLPRMYGDKNMKHWMEKQTYMALGMTMMAAAELGVEAMPLEGFDPACVDEAFKIRETGHTATVLMLLGYPDPKKQYSNPISRFESDELFTFL